MITNFDAIRSLFQEIYPSSTEFNVTGDVENVSTLTLKDGSKLSFNQTDVEERKAVLQAEYDTQEYARNRQAEYPAIADQLDEIYHNGINAWKAVIKVTKDKYPKG